MKNALNKNKFFIAILLHSSLHIKLIFKKLWLLLPALLFSFSQAGAQADSVINLENISVSAFSISGSALSIPAAVAIIDSNFRARFASSSILPAFNSIAGVRMEERSPESERLSIRGSLLRSPFGIRNVKIYYNHLPFSDASGNAYLNLIDWENLSSIEIIKGPASSYYGANTGGIVLLKSIDNTPNNAANKHLLKAGMRTGSYGLWQEHILFETEKNKWHSAFIQSHQQSNGYRYQSASKKDVLQWSGNWQYGKHAAISFIQFYTHLRYETPGGITFQQMMQNPRMARQPSAALPGAEEQQAGINNKTYFFSTTWKDSFSLHLSNITSVGFSYTNLKNPFITNYEKRKEWNYSGRTEFQYASQLSQWKIQLSSGLEAQYNATNKDVYDNNRGIPTNVQYKDKLHATQYFLFVQSNLSWQKKWNFQIGGSYNQLHYWYKRTTNTENNKAYIKNTGLVLSPRFAVSYQIKYNSALYASISKGFSPPTLTELLPSEGTFHKQLQAEYGWNYEIGFKGFSLQNRLSYHTSFYYFQLENAIVRRNDSLGAEYFINAGGTVQKGIEVEIHYLLFQKPHNYFIRSLALWNSFSYQPYYFNNYKTNSQNLSGNPLTGVPKWINVAGIDGAFRNNYFLHIHFNYTSSISLNDAHTVEASPSYLLNFNLQKEIYLNSKKSELFIGINNVLNELYSLGNDINAAGERYYNPAPPRNVFIGFQIQL